MLIIPNTEKRMSFSGNFLQHAQYTLSDFISLSFSIRILFIYLF